MNTKERFKNKTTFSIKDKRGESPKSGQYGGEASETGYFRGEIAVIVTDG